jgi:ribosomal protein S12 methylthiotransferase accessory factor
MIGALTDPRLGIVPEVRDEAIAFGEPRFIHVAASACDTRAFSAPANFRFCGGASVTRERARVKAIGEAVERYGSALYDPLALPVTTAAAADFPVADPADFALFAPTQYAEPDFPFRPFDDSTTIAWTSATDLATGEIRGLPAAAIWAPYHVQADRGEFQVIQSISTGLASHQSRDLALVNALCEVIERDAFMLAWLGQRAPPQFNRRCLPPSVIDLIGRFEAAGYRVMLFDLTSDSQVPCVMAIIEGLAPRPVLTVAAAADPRTERAMIKALEEAAHTQRYQAVLLETRGPAPAEFDPLAVHTQADHIGLAASPAWHWAYAPFIGDERRVDPPRDLIANAAAAATEELAEAVAAAIRATGHATYAADLTPPDLAVLGYHVFRAVVPGYQPLTIGSRLRPLGGVRLAQALGGGEAYASPHPFP